MADRKHLIKYIIITVVLLIFAALAGLFTHARRPQGQPVPIPEVATKALMTLVGIHQTATKEGQVQWELDADSAQLEADGNRMILTAPRVDFVMKDGTKVRLTAKQGVLDTHNNDMAVSGEVRLRNDQYLLETEALAYQHDRRTLHSDAPVHIIGPAFDLRADQMTYNLEENRAQFDGRVEGNFNEAFSL
ncbi:MAG: LPS export ABC transporter periplasmic protein LptC [Desulfatitalea sp.]